MAGPRTLLLEDLDAHVGNVLGASDWIEVTQSSVDSFADVTEDRQWIHVDPERAANGPFGGPVAHGYLVLSLCTHFIASVVAITDASAQINYGLERVRFPAPTHVGARIRGVVSLGAVEPVAGGKQVRLDVTVEREHHEKPVCVAAVVGRFLA